MKEIRIGTRGSRLALTQARMAQAAVEAAMEGIQTQLVILHTKGDKILDKPLAEIGDKGLFVSEFEQAILRGEIDMAVHSAKDLPLSLAYGLTIAAVLQRADVRDVLVMKKGGTPPWERGAFVLGTGSQRRCAQANRLWKGSVCRQIRGNVETRLKKLEEGGYDGLLLAKAGLDRLLIDESSHPQFVFYPLDPEQFLPAACQGIIALETVADSRLAGLLRRISDRETELAFRVERRVLELLQADCSEPAAAWCRTKNGVPALDVMYGEEWAAGCCQPLGGEASRCKDRGAEEQLSAAMRMADDTVRAMKGQVR